MKVALLQEERYLPSFHGSNKSNRCLLESLSREGHDCLALCSVSPPGACTDGVAVREMPPRADHEERSAFLFSSLKEFDPDIVLVSSSKYTYALATALQFAADRVIYLVHSHDTLPFGLIRAARRISVIDHRPKKKGENGRKSLSRSKKSRSWKPRSKSRSWSPPGPHQVKHP